MSDAPSSGVGFAAMVTGAGGLYPSAECGRFVLQWMRGNVHTNSIEDFWSNVKRSIRGTHVWVSKKHLQTYLCEFEYRYNLRKEPERMMDALLNSFPRA
jgi:hypothetical protein